MNSRKSIYEPRPKTELSDYLIKNAFVKRCLCFEGDANDYRFRGDDLRYYWDVKVVPSTASLFFMACSLKHYYNFLNEKRIANETH